MHQISKYNLGVPQRTLRRFSERTVRIADRHADNPTIVAAAAVAVPKAKTFTTKYDDRQRLKQRREQNVAEGNDRVGYLARLLGSRLPIVAAHLGRDLSDYVPTTDVPDDVIPAARRFLADTKDHAGEESLLTQIIVDIETAANEADAEWVEARELTAREQVLGQEVRDAAIELHQALVMFRRVLAAELGRRHVDYQALRYARSRPEEDDTATADNGTKVDSEAPTEPAIDAAAETQEPQSGAFATAEATAG